MPTPPPVEYKDASPQVRAVFDDIKASRNVPDVNNFWKFLARDPALIRKYDVAGPRYTSYPTADRFHTRFGAADARAAFELNRNTAADAPLSLYVHIPFCEQLCYYCACNKIITKHHERATAYLDALEAELALVLESLGSGRPISQLHFGGGSPTFLSDEELTRVMRTLTGAFRLTPGSEVSIEVDPRTVTPARLEHFRRLGFNRLSFGVQDFDPAVQQAVHRVQPYEQVQALVRPCPEAMLAAYAVGKAVGNVRNDGAGLIQPL